MIKFYLVGGCVRDEILGHMPADIDYSVEASSFNHMKDHLIKSNFEIYVEKPEYGTLKAKCPLTKKVSDYTLCRKDGFYSDCRRPDSIEASNILEDLSRRDFTMNAIAKIDGEYYDPFFGIQDIENKLIRCVGKAADRLTEDPLRGLRALRFSITKGFTISPDILEIIETDAFITNFKKLAKERIQVELQKMFHHNTVRSIKLLSGLSKSFLEVLFVDSGIWLLPTLKIKKK